jgi:O-antigen ligase
LKSLPFVFLAAFLTLVFLVGGGSRPDVASLALLRPAAALMLVAGLWNLDLTRLRDFRILLLFAGACALWIAIQLVPLPPGVWQSVPGRELAAQVDAAVGISVWRPLSLVPWRSWNALFSLLVPVAVLIWAIRCSIEARQRLLFVLLGLGAVSALLGLLQLLGPPSSSLYFYRITNTGTAVGLFANRNHQAALLTCMLPMLAAFASAPGAPHRAAIRGWIALGAGALIVLLVLSTGSRAGVVMLLAGLLLSLFIYRPAGRPLQRRHWIGMLLIALGTAALAGASVFLSRAVAIERLTASEEGGEVRIDAWRTIADALSQYFPFGSGSGSFEDIYRIAEPTGLIDRTYLNHAHNDWLEILLTDGAVGALLLIAAITMWAVSTLRSLRTHKPGSVRELHRRTGASIVLMLAIASLVDYPLRTPSLASLMIISALWMIDGRRLSDASSAGSEQQNP